LDQFFKKLDSKPQSDRIEGDKIILNGLGQFQKKVIIIGIGEIREYRIIKTKKGRFILT